MKKNLLLAILTIAAITLATSCSNSHSEKVDPIYGTTPVTNAFYTDANGNENFPLDQYHKLGLDGDTSAQRALVNQYRKVLTANIIRQYPQISSEKNILFVLGSGFATDVMSGDGKTYSGPFLNELIVILNDPNIQDTLFLACGNGMLRPLNFESQTEFGQGDPWIEIRENDSYAMYFPNTWGEMAKSADIGIRDANGKMVTPETYNEKPGDYFSMLRTGDKINIITGEVVDENWKSVNFKSRQADTEKANAKAKAKVKPTKKPQKGKQGKRR
jgi:uncharacterized membrane protein